MCLVSSSFEILLLWRSCRFEKLQVRVEDKGIVHRRVAGSNPQTDKNNKKNLLWVDSQYHICVIFLSMTYYFMAVESLCEFTLQTMR